MAPTYRSPPSVDVSPSGTANLKHLPSQVFFVAKKNTTDLSVVWSGLVREFTFHLGKELSDEVEPRFGELPRRLRMQTMFDGEDATFNAVDLT